MKIISMTYEALPKGARMVQIYTDTETINIVGPPPESREGLPRGWPGLLKAIFKAGKEVNHDAEEA